MTFVITDQNTINAIQDAYNAQNLPLAYTLVFNAITTTTITEVPDGAPIVTQAPAVGVDPAVWAWVGGAINVTRRPKKRMHISGPRPWRILFCGSSNPSERLP